MADAIVTLKVMPDGPEVDLDSLQEQAKKIIEKEGGEVGKKEIEPIGFGIKAIKLTYVVDESLGGTEPVEKAVQDLEGVASAEVVDVRRAIG